MKRPRNNPTEISITIRFPKELVAKIKELAKKHIRSTNGEVIYLVQKAIESEETKWGGRKKPKKGGK